MNLKMKLKNNIETEINVLKRFVLKVKKIDTEKRLNENVNIEIKKKNLQPGFHTYNFFIHLQFF